MPLNCLLKSSPSGTAPELAKRVRFAQDKAKSYTNTVRHAKPTTFKVGEYVRTLRPFKRHKLEPKWSEPKKIVHVRNATLTLEDGGSGTCGNVFAVHNQAMV
jgi:hypothetical protein